MVQNGRVGGGASKDLPLQRGGAEQVLAMPKGGESQNVLV